MLIEVVHQFCNFSPYQHEDPQFVWAWPAWWHFTQKPPNDHKVVIKYPKDWLFDIMS
jgi:hypothetical protein